MEVHNRSIVQEYKSKQHDSHISRVRSLNILDFCRLVVAKDCHTGEEYHHDRTQRNHNQHQVPIFDSLDMHNVI